jgi:hypothetical protein
MRAVRWLALSIGILFLVGTVFQLVDWFNLYATPPDTQAANMVDQRLAAQDLPRRDLADLLPEQLLVRPRVRGDHGARLRPPALDRKP